MVYGIYYVVYGEVSGSLETESRIRGEALGLAFQQAQPWNQDARQTQQVGQCWVGAMADTMGGLNKLSIKRRGSNKQVHLRAI